MSQQVQRGVTSVITVLLTKAGVAVTGLAFGDVTCAFRKFGGSITGKTLTAPTFVEVGSGYYDVTFDGATELDVAGALFIIFTGATIDRCDTDAVVVVPPDSTTKVVLPVCILSGNLNGPDGPAANVAVFARPITPMSLNGTMLDVEPWTTSTDENGGWVLRLPRGAVMEVVSPKVGYLRRLTVPNRPSASIAEVP